MKRFYGLNEAMPKEFQMLEEIFEYQVFELQIGQKNGKNYGYIPYMMNDALECYLVLKEIKQVGEYVPSWEGEMWAEIDQKENQYVLIVHQGEEHVFTLWFYEIEEKCECYQYHSIGHFWVKGQEQWRQLVYIIGTIYEKYEYLGMKVCNQEEMQILSLIEFAPFCYWSPIRESLEGKYPKTYEGINCMDQMAKEAGDYKYRILIWLYRKLPFRWMEKFLAQRLTVASRENLYQVIWNKVERASSFYKTRSYPPDLNEKISKCRKKTDQILKEEGFSGKYPAYHKKYCYVQVTEEHPFTILESKDFNFKIQCMVSECKQKKVKRNSGFFHGLGRKGWIRTI